MWSGAGERARRWTVENCVWEGVGKLQKRESARPMWDLDT